MNLNLGFYDYVTFAALIIVGLGLAAIFVLTLSIPGMIAIKRKHPHAEAVRLMGNLGFLGGVSWVTALIWSFHDSWTVDIRRFPEDEREYIREELEKLGGKPKPAKTHPLAAEVEGHSHGSPEAGAPRKDTGASASGDRNSDSDTYRTPLR